MKQKEVFKDVPNYEGYYQVSNLGRVKSLNYNRTNKPKIMRVGIDKDGYGLYGLSINGVRKTFKAHHLVLMAFNPKEWINRGTNVVDHIDNKKLNNNLDNLQIISRRLNGSKDRRGSSKYTGVVKTNHNTFISQININKEHYYLGSFKTELQAHEAYQNKLKQIKDEH